MDIGRTLESGEAACLTLTIGPMEAFMKLKAIPLLLLAFVVFALAQDDQNAPEGSRIGVMAKLEGLERVE